MANLGTTRQGITARSLALLLVPIGAYFLLQHALPRLGMTEASYTEYYWPRRFWLFSHTVAGLLATLLGPVQFIRGLRARHPALHRLTGRVYLTSVLIGAICALALAATVTIGETYPWASRSYQAGLVLGAGLWLLTAAIAFTAIRRRQVARTPRMDVAQLHGDILLHYLFRGPRPGAVRGVGWRHGLHWPAGLRVPAAASRNHGTHAALWSTTLEEFAWHCAAYEGGDERCQDDRACGARWAWAREPAGRHVVVAHRVGQLTRAST